MRPGLVLVISGLAALPAYAGSPNWAEESSPLRDRQIVAAPAIDFGNAARFAPRPGETDEDVLLSKPLTPPPVMEKRGLPGVNMGLFHGTLGGAGTSGGRGHGHLASYVIDTRVFWNSSISGSIDRHGANVFFTLPMQ
ncbi:MAG TPA: hypothetical protein VII49_05415 [Rhizomicrobium sp.]